MGDEAKKETFEGMIRRLQEVVETLEVGGKTLEESLELFEEGVNLSRRASTRLDEAERRIEEFLEDGQEKPLDSPDDESASR